MNSKDIIRIKQHGTLIALDQGISGQYWHHDGALYFISVDGTRDSLIWAADSRLAGHLARIYQITGRRFFTEDPDKVIVDTTKFLSQFIYA